jgi:hypothetical protein
MLQALVCFQLFQTVLLLWWFSAVLLLLVAVQGTKAPEAQINTDKLAFQLEGTMTPHHRSFAAVRPTVSLSWVDSGAAVAVSKEAITIKAVREN